MVASSGAKLLRDDAVETLVRRLFPLATVVTPNLPEAEALAGTPGASRRELAERIHALGAAVVVTGGHGDEAVEHLFDGETHHETAVSRHDVLATHGAGCTHSPRSRRCSPAACPSPGIRGSRASRRRSSPVRTRRDRPRRRAVDVLRLKGAA